MLKHGINPLNKAVMFTGADRHTIGEKGYEKRNDSV